MARHQALAYGSIIRKLQILNNRSLRPLDVHAFGPAVEVLQPVQVAGDLTRPQNREFAVPTHEGDLH
jgi:hypothetical protein